MRRRNVDMNLHMENVTTFHVEFKGDKWFYGRKKPT
jgi:hypothetical protein